MEFLANHIDIILHCGAHVNSILPYSALKDTNVNGTLELLKLCTFGKPKLFHFVSTAGILHGISSDVIEDPANENHPFIDKIGGYAQSKWVAERLVIQAASKGLRVSISRPSRISPHSKTAYYNPTDFMVCLICF